tara:strand:- start:302 stop:937 length:636 start_codon:yes stop_codon:yes gene_type:complete
MSKTTIPTGGITADAINSTLIADDAVSEEHLDATALTGNTALAATPATTDEILISDAGTLKRLDFSFLMNRPAFHANFGGSSPTSISHDTSTKMAFDNEDFDTDSCYDPSSNYRFTPNVAGKYFFYAQISSNSTSDYDNKYWNCEIKKNGTTIITHNNQNSYYTSTRSATVTEMNGSSDYVECFGYHTFGTSVGTDASNLYCYFGGYRLVA